MTDDLQPAKNTVAVMISRSGLSQLNIGVAGWLRVIVLCLSVAESRPGSVQRQAPEKSGNP
jgi:hypothetical protein